MPGRAFENLGGIQGVKANPKKPYSSRGNDKDRIQTFVFECDPAAPFTGTVLLQISNDSPPVAGGDGTTNLSGGNLLWVTVMEIDVVAEGENFFVETDVEAAMVRVNCTAYTGGRITQILTMR
jgi:hypothetical protein